MPHVWRSLVNGACLFRRPAPSSIILPKNLLLGLRHSSGSPGRASNPQLPPRAAFRNRPMRLRSKDCAKRSRHDGRSLVCVSSTADRRWPVRAIASRTSSLEST